MTFCATCDPWSIASPRTASGPVKHESTPNDTWPALSVLMLPPPELPLGLELPQAATTTATAMPVRKRLGARVFGIRSMAVGDTVQPPSAGQFRGPSPVLAEVCSGRGQLCQWVGG